MSGAVGTAGEGGGGGKGAAMGPRERELMVHLEACRRVLAEVEDGLTGFPVIAMTGVHMPDNWRELGEHDDAFEVAVGAAVDALKLKAGGSLDRLLAGAAGAGAGGDADSDSSEKPEEEVPSDEDVDGAESGRVDPEGPGGLMPIEDIQERGVDGEGKVSGEVVTHRQRAAADRRLKQLTNHYDWKSLGGAAVVTYYDFKDRDGHSVLRSGRHVPHGVFVRIHDVEGNVIHRGRVVVTLVHELAHCITRGEILVGRGERAHGPEFYVNYGRLLRKAEQLRLFNMPTFIGRRQGGRFHEKALRRLDQIDTLSSGGGLGFGGMDDSPHAQNLSSDSIRVTAVAPNGTKKLCVIPSSAWVRVVSRPRDVRLAEEAGVAKEDAWQFSPTQLKVFVNACTAKLRLPKSSVPKLPDGTILTVDLLRLGLPADIEIHFFKKK